MMQAKTLTISLLLSVGAALLTPALAADAVYQRTADSGAIELSNLDNGEQGQEVLVESAVASPAQAGSALAPANLAASGAATDTAGFAARPERRAALAAVQERLDASAPAEQKYRELMVQQASFNGGANGNLASARKYLKIDRESYLTGLGN